MTIFSDEKSNSLSELGVWSLSLNFYNPGVKFRGGGSILDRYGRRPECEPQVCTKISEPQALG